LLAPLFPLAVVALLAREPLVALAAVVLRLAIGAAARIRARSPRRAFLPLDCLLADLLLWLAFIGVTSRTVRWRDHVLRIGTGGRLHRVSQDNADSANRNIVLSELR
jgi:hypothetical protein